MFEAFWAAGACAAAGWVGWLLQAVQSSVAKRTFVNKFMSNNFIGQRYKNGNDFSTNGRLAAVVQKKTAKDK